MSAISIASSLQQRTLRVFVASRHHTPGRLQSRLTAMSVSWKTPSDNVAWSECLASADDTLRACASPKVAELEAWWRSELPAALATRPDPFLRQAEVVRLVDWKLSRGTWRPRLLDFAKALQESEVRAASSSALVALQGYAPGQGGKGAASTDKLKAALDALCVLKGIGAATASAVLSCANPHVPFMSDEVLSAVVPGKPQYSPKECLAVAAALQDKAAQLSLARNGGKADWTARDVERCLFTSALLAKGGGGGRGGETGKGAKKAAAPEPSRPTSAAAGSSGGRKRPAGAEPAAAAAPEPAGAAAVNAAAVTAAPGSSSGSDGGQADAAAAAGRRPAKKPAAGRK